jgi:hypothetical protein
MSTSPTLPTGPLEHIAIDYEALRAEGMRLLGRLAGAQWTDFNAHDPGVTILEQLCYAITDLALSHLTTRSPTCSPAPTSRSPCPARPRSSPATRSPRPTCASSSSTIDGRPQRRDRAARRARAPVYSRPRQRRAAHLPDPSDPAARPVQLAGLHRVLLQADDRLRPPSSRSSGSPPPCTPPRPR